MPATANNNETYPATYCGPASDAHGQAALLLVESLIYGLVERSVIRATDAAEVKETAVEIQSDAACEFTNTPETMRRSYNLLAAISDSLARA